MIPAFENNLSAGAELQGTDRSLRAIVERAVLQFTLTPKFYWVNTKERLSKIQSRSSLQCHFH